MKVEFKTNHDNSFITVLIPSYLDLSERQTEILSDQLEAVYGINRYYVQEIGEEILQPKTTALDTVPHDTALDISADTSVVNTTNANKAWQEIRKGLIEELGEAIDTVWFSKAVAKECTETNTLTLTMQNKFMSDFIKSRYGYAMSRISGTFGFKYIEYNH